MRIDTFTRDHVDGAAALLAARQARHRAGEPLLPERFEQPAAAREEIERLLEQGAEGVAATRGARVVAYIVGTRSSDAVWGPNVWVELAGHAAERAEDVRDAYASAAAFWVAAGRTAHYAVVPASDGALVDAWFRLGFGQQHAYGIRELPAKGSVPPGVRVAERRDVDALVALAPLLSRHQMLSPVFSAGPSANDTQDEIRSEIEADLADPEIGNLVAEVDGRVVGNFVVVPVKASSTHSGLARPEGAAMLAWAATLPEVRGSGSGRALTDAALAWARGRGYDVVVTDWRVTNLLSSRFWPARGFRTTFLRLHRLLA